MTLIEALVALLVMAFGMVALVGLQSNMRRSSDVAKQRGEAVRLAQQEIERLRAFSVLTLPTNNPPVGVRDYDGINAPADRSNAILDSNATFALSRSMTPWFEPSQLTTPMMKALAVNVSWKDRADDEQSIQLHTFISRTDPGLGGALGVAPTSAALRAAGGRSPVIPVGAKDLGDKTSVFVPTANATVAWVFNNLTGVIVGLCTVSMGTDAATLTAAGLATCSNNTLGFLLSGVVRFSFASPPNPETPASPALPLLDFQIVRGDALAQPADKPAAVVLAVPDAPSHQCFNDSPPDGTVIMPLVNYYCVVFPNADTTPYWNGKLNITGLGSAYKACRYSADYNGDGVLLNNEHPLNYCSVTKSMARQNFLVVRSSESCPAGHAVDASAGYFSNTATVAHEVENRTLPYPTNFRPAMVENRCPGPR